MPILDIEPGQSPEAPGTLYFYRQGQPVSSGFRVDTSGQLLAPGNDALVWPAGEFQPPDHGLKSWTYDPGLATSSSSVTNGTLYLAKMPIRADTTMATLAWSLGSAAVTPTAGQNWVGAYDPDGDLLNSLNVDTASSSSGAKLSTLAASVAAPWVWGACLFNAATPPALSRSTTFTSTPNIGLTAAQYRWCTNGTGLTTLPASINPASNSIAAVIANWMGIG